MRILLLLAATAVPAALTACAFVLLLRAPISAASLATSEAIATVHPTTEADLALLRGARPTLNGPVLVGLHMRWCSAQNACR